jgi:hypothetical protein
MNEGAIAFSIGCAANSDDHLQEMTLLLGMLIRAPQSETDLLK